MRRMLLAIVLVALILGCKDNPVSEKIRETKKNVSNTRKAVKEMNDLQKDMQELQQLEPLTNEELKSWLPDEVNGMKRIAYKAGQTSYLQIASVEATYANEDKSKKFKIMVMDGAGEMGASATAAIRLMLSQDFEEEDENKMRRTVKKDGEKAVEEYRKNSNRSTVEYLGDNRFYIKGEGTNMDLEETWDTLKKFDPDDLG